VDAKINETFDDKTLLRKYKEEIETLKQKLSQMESMINSNDVSTEAGDPKRRRRGPKPPAASDESKDLPAVGRSRADSDSGDSSSEDDENKQEIILRVRACIICCIGTLLTFHFFF
jgi:hypothetical protein